jgi:hypothetical protein
MTIADKLMIFAVIVGPILAVQVQKTIEAWKSGRERKIHIFRVLMATRGTPVTPNHVEALNLIDIEFSGNNKKEKSVRDAWKIYLNHLCEYPKDYQDPAYKSKVDIWTNKTSDCLVDMLYTMAQILGYDFDKVQLKKGAYTPQGFLDLESEQSLVRRGLLDVLYGKRGIPVIPFENLNRASPGKSENQIQSNKS